MMVSAARVEQIASVLEFTLDELAMNRVGKLSSHQVWLATKTAVVQGGFAVLLLGGAIVLVFGVGLTGIRRVAFYALALLALASDLPFASLFVAAAVAKRVVVPEGPLDLHGTGRGTVAVVGSQPVLISWTATKVLKSGEHYRIYSLAYSNTFLSIEPVSPDPPATEEAR
jgi:hypothetical protein